MFDGKYLEWNRKRIKAIIDHYGHQFMFKKSVLDLGCGHGDISGALYRLGADVTVLDARHEHLKITGKKFPGIKIVKADLDQGWPFIGKYFDLILDLDLLCHLNDYEAHLRAVCASATNLVLETAVCDSNDPYKNFPIPENKNIYDLSVNGQGCRPSAAAIERVLSECKFRFKRIDNDKINSTPYVYNWQSQNNDACDINKRRLWFAEKTVAVHFPAPKPQLTPHNIAGIIPENFTPNLTAMQQPPNNPPPPPQNRKDFRIAVCISGHLRTFERAYPTFMNNIIGQYRDNVDVFVHTWHTLGAQGSKNNSDSSIAHIKTSSKMPQIRTVIDPKMIEVEGYDVYNSLLAQMNVQAKLSEADKDGLHHRNFLHYGSLLYSSNRVRQILEKYEKDSNITYDMVIRLRADLEFPQRIELKNYLDGKLHVPNTGQCYDAAVNDQFAIGSSKDIKIYLGLFEDIIRYMNNRECYSCRPEIFLKHHLRKNGVVIVEDYLPHYILRADGTVTKFTTVPQTK